MPKEKLFVSKRHARRKRRNAILKLVSGTNDNASDLSNDAERRIFDRGSSIQGSSNGNYIPDGLELQPHAHEHVSDFQSTIENICHASDSLSLSNPSLTQVVVSGKLYENSDFYDSDESAPNTGYGSTNDTTNFDGGEMYNDDCTYELCSSDDSSHDGDINDSSLPNEESYTFTVDPSTIRERLKNVLTTHNATLALSTDLLHLLNPMLPFLPQDGRTLLQTPRSTETIKLANGEMCYFGIETCIQNKLKGCQLPTGFVIQLDFNIDGLPLFKSSSTEFWPILGRICSMDGQNPFAIAIFCGQGKPDPKELFLSQFIDEVKALQTTGIKHDNVVHEVTIRCFSCDAPARSWLKCVKSHSAKAGCERCTTLATVKNQKLYYPTTDADCSERKDRDFRRRRRHRNKNKTKHTSRDNREKQQAEHITGSSPLLEIRTLGLVTQFILDPMHLVYLGVMKRLALKYWVGGKRPFKLSMQHLQIINNKIRTIRDHIPSDFARKGRSLLEIKRLKATELRLILLYTGPIFLHDVLSKDKFSHFLLLHAAITILSCESHVANYIQIAREALKRFVRESAEIYESEFVVYNVHSLLHIADDVEKYGPLDNYSCFAFENYLKTLKSRVRAKTCPLQQIANRISELNNISTLSDSDEAVKYYPIGVTPTVDIHAQNEYFECVSLKRGNFKISSKRPDNVVSMNGLVYIIKKIFFIHGPYKCIGTSFRFMEDLYTDPLLSSDLNIFYSRSLGDSFTFAVDQIAFKCLRVGDTEIW